MYSTRWNVIYVGQIEIGVRGWNLFWHVSLNVLQTSNPTDRARESHPCVNLHQERLLQLLQNCVKLRFVSCTIQLIDTNV